MALARRHAACVAAAAARVRVRAPCAVAHRGVVPAGTCARRVRAATCEATRACTTAAHKLAADIAVIDVAPFRHGSPAEKQYVADQVARACETIGFFGVTGHGLPDAVVRAAWNEAWAFFDRVNEGTPEALAMRKQVQLPHGGYPYGYAPMASESLAGSLGEEAPADLKETFSIGPLQPPPAVPEDPVAQFAFSPNRWPSSPAFQAAMQTYFHEANACANELLRVFAMALDLAPDFFESKVQHHMSALRLNNYPALSQPPLPRQLRAGAHCDYGTLTVLMPHQGDRGGEGLQVYSQDAWRDVDVPAGVFVINVGDLIARWTNDRWKSTLHRVVVREGSGDADGHVAARRMSLAFFHQPDWDADVEVVPSCVAAGSQPLYEPTTAGKHIKDKFEAAGISV